MSKRKVTIKDVARVCQVSPTTISNYLNGRYDEMRPDTLDQIRKAIRELGYLPNSAARQLKTGQTSMLGLLIPSVANPYYGELAVAIDHEAQERGFRVILCNTLRQPEREMMLVNELLASGVKGILASSVLQNTRTMHTLIKRGVAFILFEAQEKFAGMNHVDIISMDNLLAVNMAVNHLVSLGHSLIAYATATPLTPHRMIRINSYLNTLKSHGIQQHLIITDTAVCAGASAINDQELTIFGHLAAHHIMTLSPRPSAIVALNDQIALGMMFAFLELGIKIPEEISIVGIDDIQLSRFVFPALTTVRQPYEIIAKAALKKVCLRLQDPTRLGEALYFKPTFFPRASTMPFVIHKEKKG